MYFFFIFWNILSLVFPGNNPKWKLILLLIFYNQSHIWQNSGSSLMGQIYCQPIKFQDFVKCNISRKVNGEVYFWHADKHWGFLQVDNIILGVCSQACQNYIPKIRSLHILAISPEKRGEWNWLYVILMSHMRFRVSLQSIVASMSRNSLLETGAISEVWVSLDKADEALNCLAWWSTVIWWSNIVSIFDSINLGV